MGDAIFREKSSRDDDEKNCIVNVKEALPVRLAREVMLAIIRNMQHLFRIKLARKHLTYCDIL